MTAAPAILLIDTRASDRTLSRVLLQHHLPDAVITDVPDAVAFADALSAGTPDVIVIAADLPWATITEVDGIIRRRSPRAAVILFGRKSEITTKVLQPGLACQGVLSKSSAGYLALGAIVKTALARTGGAAAALGFAGDIRREPAASAEPPRAERRESADDVREIALLFSHDLREPVQQLVRLAQTSQAGGEPKSDDRTLSHVLDRAQRLSRMLDGMTQYLKVSARSATTAVIDLHACMEKALANLSPSITESHADVQIANSPLMSTGDEQQIVHLFQNLVANAIKFRRSDSPVIAISAERCGDRWLMRFRDNGIGIPEAAAERIFELGTRLHSAKEYPGAGIGLALCKRIVERHGGRIWVESHPGEGSTFLVLLPYAER